MRCFVLERIPEIENVFFGVGLSTEVGLSAESQKNIPLHEYYSPLMVAPGLRTNNKFDLKKALEDIRHNMTDESIVLRPYREYPVYKAQRIFFSRTVLINFDKLQYHEPEKGPDNFQLQIWKKWVSRIL